MRNIVETPSKDFKLKLTPHWTGNGPSDYSRCYDDKDPNALENFRFEDDLVFDSFSGKDVYFNSLDGLFQFRMTFLNF